MAEHDMTAPAQLPSPAPTLRSCIVCRQRKVRCDKKVPCSGCVRAGHRCAYPATNARRSTARKPKATISDIAGRLKQLEGTMLCLAGREPAAPEPEPAASYSGQGTADNGPSSRQNSMLLPGVLRSSEGMSEYVNELLLSRVLDEQEEEDESCATTGPSEAGGNSTAAEAASSGSRIKTSMESPIGYPFPAPGPSAADSPGSPVDLLPSRGESSQLWHAFVQNTIGLRCVLHMPTTQMAIFTAIDDPANAPADMLCLLHAIWFLAITSLWPAEAATMLQMPKPEALARSKKGFEMALAAANIMERPTLTALQAAALFLEALRAHRVARSDWAFLGLVIHLAQSLGVHRDGSAFPRMSLFEGEMRRRLWWYLQAQDKRAAEDHGFVTDSVSGPFPADSSDYTARTYGPRLPLHVDDSALHPAMVSMPPPATQFCATTHFLVMTQASLALQQLSHAAINGASEVSRQKVLDELLGRLSPLMNCLSPVIPEQKATLLACRIVLAKRDFESRVQSLSRHPSSSVGHDHEHGHHEGVGGSSTSGDNAVPMTPAKKAALMEASLVLACDIVDMDHEIHSDELLRNFRWLAECYPHNHLLLYILWYLNVRPKDGPNVQRAWAAVGLLFEHEAVRAWRQGAASQAEIASGYRPSGVVWDLFLRLRDKALSARARVDKAEASSTDKIPAVPTEPEPEKRRSASCEASQASNTSTTRDNTSMHATTDGGVEMSNGSDPPSDTAHQLPGGCYLDASAPALQHGDANLVQEKVPEEAGEFIQWDSRIQDWDTLLADFGSNEYGYWLSQ